MQDLSLIIPAKYESESLPIFLNEIKDFKCKKIVILEKKLILIQLILLKVLQNIKIHYQKIKGYGAAIREGINIADTKYFCIINADGSMNPNYLDKMFQKIKIIII